MALHEPMCNCIKGQRCADPRFWYTGDKKCDMQKARKVPFGTFRFG